jgi:hypothetical protein
MKTIYVLAALSLSLLFGCKKFVQVNSPITSLTSSTVYSNNVTAAAALTGIYVKMSPGVFDGYTDINGCLGLAADEFKNYANSNAVLQQFYMNSLSPTGNYTFWSLLYNYIYDANAAIEGLNGSSSISPSLKQQLKGEAEFVRAFANFYLVNLFGDVPLVTTTNYQTNNAINRASRNLVYQQIIVDLKDAQTLLSANFVDPTGVTTAERVRPNKGAATALLARVYLYTGAYDSAKIQAANIIANSSYSLTSLSNVFLKNSKETIWQLQTITPNIDTYSAADFILTTAPGNNFPFALNSTLVSAFETNDNRFANWVGKITSGGKTYYFPTKYKVGKNKPITEYFTVLRLSEQYLIRAEAEVQLGDTSNAKIDLNAIRSRAGLSNTTAITQSDLLAAIQHERQVELFTEFGHRWLDLKRTGTIDAVMSIITPQKGGTWTSNWALLPVPVSEITINPNLTQNPGYSN